MAVFEPNIVGMNGDTFMLNCTVISFNAYIASFEVLDYVSILTADIYSAFLQKQYLNAAFLDIKSTFLSVHIPYLLQMMLNHGIRLLFTKFIGNLFSPFTLYYSP